MDSLPLEMLERILYFVDGHALIRASAVCTMWRDVAKLFDGNQSHWKNICFKEIPRSALLELTIKKYPYWRSNSKENDQLKWKELYLTWLQWKVLANFIYHIDTLSEHKSCCVTCLKLIEDSVVVGLHNGEVKAWKTLSGDPFLVSKHRARVTCLEVISLLDERKVAKEDKHLHYIVSTSHDRLVKISYLIEEGMVPKVFDICQHRCSTVMVRGQQNYFATLDDSGKISVFYVCAPRADGIMPIVNLIAFYQPHGHAILSLEIWGTMVTGMTSNGSILTADFLESNGSMSVLYSPENRTVHVTTVEDGSSYFTQVNYHEGLEIFQYYSWRSKIFLWVSDDHKMYISLNGYEYYEYDPVKFLKSYPRTALLYGNTLVLGMESGSVVIYYFEAPEDLLNLDLKLFHWQHPVTKKPVIGMDIWEGSSGPQLAVLSHSDIHLIEWPFSLEDIIEI